MSRPKIAENVYWLADVEYAERGDCHVHLERSTPLAKGAASLAARDDAAQQVDDRPVEVPMVFSFLR